MNRRLIISLASVCAISAVVLVAVLAANLSGAAETKAGSQPSAPAQIGSKETAKWTDTTVKAAGTPEQKAVLAGGKVTTITGELVEVSCYLQLGKRGEAHIPCGSDCLKNGQPAGIVDKDGKLTILFVEEHDPRRHGEIDIRNKFVELLAKQVTATGMLTKTKDGYQALYIQGAELAAAK